MPKPQLLRRSQPSQAHPFSAVSQELRQQKEFLEEDRSKLWTAGWGGHGMQAVG